MADFKTAYDITGHNEGGYANNPNDHGGETYCGIARKFWDNWHGWPIIDSFKGQPKFISIVNSSLQLQDLVRAFYKANFWDVNKLDKINDQQVANNVYDCGVNMGTVVAAKYLQRAAGVIDDGIIGSKTIAAVNEDSPEIIFGSLNKMREDRYRVLASKPGQSQFLKSWLGRLKTYKS